jgi:hypothetical protein
MQSLQFTADDVEYVAAHVRRRLPGLATVTTELLPGNAGMSVCANLRGLRNTIKYQLGLDASKDWMFASTQSRQYFLDTFADQAATKHAQWCELIARVKAAS